MTASYIRVVSQSDSKASHIESSGCLPFGFSVSTLDAMGAASCKRERVGSRGKTAELLKRAECLSRPFQAERATRARLGRALKYHILGPPGGPVFPGAIRLKPSACILGKKIELTFIKRVAVSMRGIGGRPSHWHLPVSGQALGKVHVRASRAALYLAIVTRATRSSPSP